MGLKQTNIIDPYVPWTGLGDYAFNDDVNAISEYIENQRPQIPNHPTLQATIEEYEQWLMNLSWAEKYFTPETSLRQAVYYRDKVNSILGQQTNPTWIPSPNKIIAQNPADAPTFLSKLLGSSGVSTLKWTVALLSGGAIIYLFGPAIRAVVKNKFVKEPTHNDIIKEQQP